MAGWKSLGGEAENTGRGRACLGHRDRQRGADPAQVLAHPLLRRTEVKKEARE